MPVQAAAGPLDVLYRQGLAEVRIAGAPPPFGRASARLPVRWRGFPLPAIQHVSHYSQPPTPGRPARARDRTVSRHGDGQGRRRTQARRPRRRQHERRRARFHRARHRGQRRDRSHSGRRHPIHRIAGPVRAARGDLAPLRRDPGPGHRPAPHRDHGRRLGRPAAGLRRAGVRRRRSPDARPVLSMQPPFRGQLRGPGGAGALFARGPLPARRPPRGRPLGRAHARRAGGLAVEPNRHLDDP